MSPEPGLRVLLAPSAYYPHVGGIEEATRQLARFLAERGHRPLVLTNRWPAGTAAAESLEGVDVRRLRLELPSVSRGAVRFAVTAPRSATELVRLVRAFRPDVAHVIGAGPNAAYLLALRPLLGAPLVFTAQGEYRFDALRSFERSLVLRTALRRLLVRADAVTACSRYVLDELAAAMDVPAGACVVPNGVAPEDFAGVPARNGGAPYVVAAARLVRGKGLDVLVRAVAMAGDGLAGRRLVLAGEGPEREPLRRLARDLGLEGRVVFRGAVGRDRLPALLAGADAFALPSRREPFGIALLEAMAAGTPAVATAAGGVVEFARDGVNALLVPPDDPGALGEALVRLVRDGSLRARLAAGARATAERLSWRNVGAEYERLYREVARG